jgi:4-amino-4-deoxy-L-arabinose transferase-like glycosyltransferase
MHPKENDWLLVLLWLMVPIVSWSYRNNLLENTMSVFTTFSVFLIVKALKSNSIYLIPLSGVLIICAFLSKGFVGLFPIITPLIFGVLFKQNKKSIIYFFLLILSVSIFSFIAIRVFPEMTDNIVRYFNHQFLPSIKGQREITTHSRFKIIIELFLDLSVIFTLLAFLLFLRIKNTKIKTFTFNKNFLFFLFIGISASVPLIISLKQRKFYLVPSIPFYAMAFASLLNPLVMEASDKISSTVFKKINKVLYAVLVFLIIFSILKFGTYSRDMEKIKDVSMISQYLNEGTIITSSKEICSDWGLIAYFSRIGYISIDCNNEHDYFLMKNGDEFPTNYRKIVIKGMCYTLLEREVKTSQ